MNSERTLGEMVELATLLDRAATYAENAREHAFESDDPTACRTWLQRRDHLREARQAVNSMISDLRESMP